MKPTKTPREKFKAGLKKSGYDPDAGAKRLLDLIAKQKKEREEFESKYKSAYEGREMKTLKQIVEGTVVMTDFKLDKKGRKYKAHRTTMGRDVRMNEEGDYPHVGTGRSKDIQMARDIATMNAKTSLLRSIHGDNFQDQKMPDYEEDKLDLKPDEKGGYTATVKMRQKAAAPAVKEDVEQVDEISYGTLRSYVDKAKAENLPGKGGNRGVALLTPGTRDKGVHKAVDRMRKMKTNEAKDPREYDYEGDMAKSQLRSIIANAKQVHDMLKDDTNMAEWVQSKITLSADYISTVADYMQSEVKENIGLDEARGRPAGAATIAKRAAAAAKPREDDDEGEHYDADSGVEADQHIHVQLKKASDSDQKPFEVSFKNGKKHTVSQKVAKDILGATERLKPEHRKNVHDEIHQSYDNLMSVHRLIAGR